MRSLRSASQGSFPSRTDIVRKFLLFSPLPIRLIPHRGRSSPRGSGCHSAPPYTPLGRIIKGGCVLPADAVFGAVSCSRSSGAYSLLSRAALAWELLPTSQMWTVPQASGAELSCAGRDCLEIPTLSTLPPACIRRRWRTQAGRSAANKRALQVSTDERSGATIVSLTKATKGSKKAQESKRSAA